MSMKLDPCQSVRRKVQSQEDFKWNPDGVWLHWTLRGNLVLRSVHAGILFSVRGELGLIGDMIHLSEFHPKWPGCVLIGCFSRKGVHFPPLYLIIMCAWEASSAWAHFQRPSVLHRDWTHKQDLFGAKQLPCSDVCIWLPALHTCSVWKDSGMP